MMIDTIAKRRMTLNGKSYPKGAKVPMPLQQFNDLEPTGMVERAPAANRAAKPVAKPAAKKAASKAPDSAAAAVAPAAAPVPQSSGAAD